MSTTDSLYINKLKFDPNLNRGFMYTLIHKVRIVLLSILTLIIAGYISYTSLPKELNPEVNIPIVTIVTTLPGASPADIEKLITNDIEKAVSNVSGIDQLTSSSTNSVSAVTIQFVGSVDPDEVTQEVKDEVDKVVGDLPEDASTPTVQKLDFNEQPVLTVAITSQINRISLSNIATELEDKLESTSGISKVEISGAETQEIVIKLKPETFAVYNLAPNQISQAISSNNLTFPAGSIKVSDTEYTLSINNEFKSIDQIRNQYLVVGGQPITLGEIADVFYRSKIDDTIAYSKNLDGSRHNAIQLSVFKSANATISDTANNALAILDQEIENHPSVEYLTVINLANEIDKSFNDLAGNFGSTILLVFLILFVFLGIRQATIASISIPLTFLSTFVIMSILGVSVNFLSLFSLLLALGLVVDDAIVVVQAASQYGKKFKPEEAALLVFRDFVVPIWTTTLTTVWAFLPLLLATGIIGAFIRSIPIVVSATLISSTTIAVLINIPLTVLFANLPNTPSRTKKLGWLVLGLVFVGIIFGIAQGSSLAPVAVLMAIGLLLALVWSRPQLTARLSKLDSNFQSKFKPYRQIRSGELTDGIMEHGVVDFGKFASKYKRFLENTITNPFKRKLTYGLTTGFVFLSFMFLVTGLLKNEFFPAVDSDNLYINVEAPVGWSMEATDEIVQEVESRLVEVEGVKSIVSQTGSTFDPNGFGGGGSGSNTAFISLTLDSPEDRELSSLEISAMLRDRFDDIQSADVSVVEVSGGPPAGADFQVNIKGDDLAVLEQISNDFQAMVADVPGTVNITSSLKQSAGEIQVNLNDRAMAERGLSAAQVGGFLRTALSGVEASTLTIDSQDLDITLTINDRETPIEYIQNLVIPGPLGAYTLSEVADFTLETSPQSIVHEDEQRVVRVFAGTTSQISATELLAEFEAKVAKYDMPQGYTWDVGGANEENQRSINSILQAMGLSVILILVTMVLQLESFRKSALVIMVIPLAVAGVFFNLTIFGIPLSFPALIGVLALFGIVVNNSIMLVEKINQNIAFGFKLKEAISDACASRIEPIILTSLTTSAGLLPITISDPLWRGLGGSIIAGLSISVILILVLLPVTYYEVFKGEVE